MHIAIYKLNKKGVLILKQHFTDEWKLYEDGKEYNTRLGYKADCDRNERFYAGDQWYGVKANNLPTPVFNIFKRITDYIISYILSSPLKINYFSGNSHNDDVLSAYVHNVWEREKMDFKLRDLLLDAALSGDMAVHIYWDGSKVNKSGVRGDFVTECVDGINVFFGNVNDRNVQSQPYILIAGRAVTEDLRREAVKHGMSAALAQSIAADDDNSAQAGDRGSIENNGKSTFLIKYWRDEQTGKIFFNKSVKNVVIRENVNTELNMYPIAWNSYTKRKNSYHGQALGTGLAPNQIFINKIFAMAMKYMMDTAFPKAVYDKTRVSGWNNAVGSAIGVNGDIAGVAAYLEPSSINGAVITLIDRAIKYTQDCLGAVDVLMGQNIRPDNASAIIALQQSAAVPIDSVKMNLYSFVEDVGAIWLDFIKSKYKVPRSVTGVNNDKDFSSEIVDDINFSIRVDVGPSSYWSEVSTVRTLDNLLAIKEINLKQYLERLPAGYLPKKKELIEEISGSMRDSE